MKTLLFSFTLLLIAFLLEISGHGMMLSPPNRSSIWRFNDSFPVNYEDNQLFCGGFSVQYGQNDGKCGICGDNYSDPQPRDNENTGKFGLGYLTATYLAGDIVYTNILITANHIGYFYFNLCVLENPLAPEPEACFINLTLADGSEKYYVASDDYYLTIPIQLPQKLTCDHCVLRWHYNTGNSWGTCENGTAGMGCGNQETFRSCADIKIV